MERRQMLPECKVQIDSINKKIDELKDKIDGLVLNTIARDKKIDKILLGNGKLGVCSKVQVLWGCSVFIIMALVTIGLKVFL